MSLCRNMSHTPIYGHQSYHVIIKCLICTVNQELTIICTCMQKCDRKNILVITPDQNYSDSFVQNVT
jgi:hypothetical protein